VIRQLPKLIKCEPFFNHARQIYLEMRLNRPNYITVSPPN
jgi:hypothetical protein